MRSSPYRRGMRAHVRTSLGIVILLLMSSQYCVFSENRVTGEELSDFQLMESSARTTNLVDIPIPANDDAVRSIKLIISTLSDAIITGKQAST